MERVHIIVSGFVQGVLFRHNSKREAEALGLVGWNRNLPDGKVEIVAEGEKNKLAQLIGWCKKGPSLAQVDDVVVTWEKATGEFSEFLIK